MKKKLIMRCLVGAPLGLALSTIITILISFTVGDGQYYAVVPELITDFGTQLNAVSAQTVCSLIYGAAWAGASLIWEKEDWSLLRQTITHFIVASFATFPIAYILRWMKPSAFGIIGYFSIFILIYLIIWILQYLAIKKNIQQLNVQVQKRMK